MMNNEKDAKKKDFRTEEAERRFGLRDLISFLSLAGFIYGPLDERLNIKEALQKALKRPVPKHVNLFFCFGGITFLLFLIQVATGILLMMYYQPTPMEAYNSVFKISNEVPFGWLIRSVHYWGSHLIILSLLIHLFRVFLYGAYKPPRDFNWVNGMILLLIVFSFAFTGHLLPWTQDSYWAITAETEIPSAIPFIGNFLVKFLRGGPNVTDITLTRFFAFHVFILPATAAFFLIFHFLMIRRQGISEPL